LVRGEYDRAESFHLEALELFKHVENPSLVVAALNNLALVSLSRGEHDAALTFGTEAIQIAEEIGDGWGTGIALRVLGDVALFKLQFDSTVQFFQKSLKIAKTSGSRWAISDALAAFGSLAIQLGEVERGVRFLGAATALYERIGLPLPPRRRTDWRDVVRSAEAMLGGHRFHGAWGIGLRTDAQVAIAEALEYGCQMKREPAIR
jgi:tetratricopeptide (TPR) repeat protein